jgi:predicted AAA+ superfamily ATPase
MTSNGRKIDVKTVEKYLAALQASFILYQAKRYNIKGKQYLKTLEKYYVVDIGLRTLLLGSRAFDVGHILENVVYLELIRRGNDVYVGKVDNLEVDFVVVNQQGLTYYQVAATVRNIETLDRELAPLKRINDQYPKYILTLDDDLIVTPSEIKKIIIKLMELELDFIVCPHLTHESYVRRLGTNVVSIIAKFVYKVEQYS